MIHLEKSHLHQQQNLFRSTLNLICRLQSPITGHNLNGHRTKLYSRRTLYKNKACTYKKLDSTHTWSSNPRRNAKPQP